MYHPFFRNVWGILVPLINATVGFGAGTCASAIAELHFDSTIMVINGLSTNRLCLIVSPLADKILRELSMTGQEGIQ